MTQPFFNRLKDYFTEVGCVLRGEARPASIFPNTTDVGMSRERVYAEFVKQHIPASCTVSFGGFLFDQEGNESNQIDVIVVDESALRFNFHNTDGSGKSFACIDGCIAVVSVKSRLGSTVLVNTLDNLASLPHKQPLQERANPNLRIPWYDDWPDKIVYASDGIGVESLYDSLVDFYTEHPEIPFVKRPNLVHVAGKYVIHRLGPEGGKLNDGTVLPPHHFWAQTHDPDVHALLQTIINIQRIASASKQVLYEYGELVNKLAP